MKTLAKVLLAFTVIAALAVGFYFVSSNLKATYTVEVVPASERMEAFEALKRENAFTETADECSFVTLRLNAVSYSPFSAEWCVLESDRFTDTLAFSERDTGPSDISPMGSGEFGCTVLVRNEKVSGNTRFSYYILGRYHSIELNK